jgi:hypothetical protein
MGKPNPVVFKNNNVYLKYTTSTSTSTTSIEDIDYFVIPSSGSVACPINNDIIYITTTIPPSTTRRPTTSPPTTSPPTTSPPTTSPPTTSPPAGSSSTVLLLHGDVTNVGLDSSIYNNTVNVVGQVVSSSTVTKAGFGSSIFFNGNGHLSINPNNNMALGGNFTVDFWVYWAGNINNPLTLGVSPGLNYAQLVGSHAAGVAGNFLILLLSNGQIFFQVNNGYAVTDNPVITANNWIHIGMVRFGSTVNLYVNGSLRKSFVDNTTVDSTVKIGIGAEAVTSGGGRAAFVGYMDEIRFLKNAATANFPQGAPYSS